MIRRNRQNLASLSRFFAFDSLSPTDSWTSISLWSESWLPWSGNSRAWKSWCVLRTLQIVWVKSCWWLKSLRICLIMPRNISIRLVLERLFFAGKTTNGWSVYAVEGNGIVIVAVHHARIFEGFSRLLWNRKIVKGAGWPVCVGLLIGTRETLRSNRLRGKARPFWCISLGRSLSRRKMGKKDELKESKPCYFPSGISDLSTFTESAA